MRGLLTLIFFFSYLCCFSQAHNKRVTKILYDDFNVIDGVFNDRIFLMEKNNFTPGLFDMIDLKVGTLSVDRPKDMVLPINILEVRIKYRGNSPINLPDENLKRLEGDTLTYFILFDGQEYYRLFGFFTTDICRLRDKIASRGFESLMNSLVSNQILSQRQCKLLRNTILKNERVYPTELESVSTPQKLDRFFKTVSLC